MNPRWPRSRASHPATRSAPTPAPPQPTANDEARTGARTSGPGSHQKLRSEASSRLIVPGSRPDGPRLERPHSPHSSVRSPDRQTPLARICCRWSRGEALQADARGCSATRLDRAAPHGERARAAGCSSVTAHAAAHRICFTARGDARSARAWRPDEPAHDQQPSDLPRHPSLLHRRVTHSAQRAAGTGTS